MEKLVFASTGGAIYGEAVPERAEETWPPAPKAPYAASKAALSTTWLSTGRATGLRWASLRYGNVYGPRQDSHGGEAGRATFAERVLKGSP